MFTVKENSNTRGENEMKKYYVIAKKWSDEAFAIVDYVAGEFPTYMNAKIFRDAYNQAYSTRAVIKEVTIY